jgi:hypothetical protein
MVPDDAEQPRAKQLAAPSDAFFLQIENVPQNRLPAPYLELPHVRRKVLIGRRPRFVAPIRSVQDWDESQQHLLNKDVAERKSQMSTLKRIQYIFQKG